MRSGDGGSTPSPPTTFSLRRRRRYGRVWVMDLHEEIETHTFSSWATYSIVHALIDAGRVTAIECQITKCKRESRKFAASGHRGQGDLLTIDHIVPRYEGGSSRIENLRLAHLSCNSGWRSGKKGKPHSQETRDRLSQVMKQAHADGKFTKIYTPERAAKISASHKNRSPMSDETRAKISKARKDYFRRLKEGT